MRLIEACMFLVGSGLIGLAFYVLANIRGDIAPSVLLYFLLGGASLIAAAVVMFALI
jgi:hypothetical protein